FKVTTDSGELQHNSTNSSIRFCIDGMPNRVENRLRHLFQSGEVSENQPRPIKQRSRGAA
ncbi:MAG TPA: hypothetical protein VKG02_25275, partial [Blastocatellia bacterium]|nr:hypothetical protein [Blastocatellia bacterium]